VRARGAGKKQEIVTVEAFVSRLQDEIGTRVLGTES
jgi:hypothetical protein